MTKRGGPPRVERVRVLILQPEARSEAVAQARGSSKAELRAVVVVEADGIVGLGEAPTDSRWIGEDAWTVRDVILSHLAPAVLGKPLAPLAMARDMGVSWPGSPYAKSALEMALWDALGRAAGLPLCRLLGGASPTPIPIRYMIGPVDAATAAEDAKAAEGRGFAHIKVKVGGSADADIARTQAVIEAAQSGFVGVDANGSWSRLQATRMIQELAELGVRFVEQPLPRGGTAWRDLVGPTQVPLIAHESIRSIEDGVAAARDGLADAWTLTPSAHGGLAPTLQLLALADAHGIPCALGGTLELGIATAYLAHLAIAFPKLRSQDQPPDLVGPLHLGHGAIRPSTTVDAGCLTIAELPGLGVELDIEQAVLEDHAERTRSNR